MLAPDQIYRTPQGTPMIYVRMERRPMSVKEEHLFAFVKDRTLTYLWLPLGEQPDGYELVHDTRGRLEGEVFRQAMEDAEHQRDAMLAAMKRAVSMLPHEDAQEIRKVYKEKMAWSSLPTSQLSALRSTD